MLSDATTRQIASESMLDANDDFAHMPVRIKHFVSSRTIESERESFDDRNFGGLKKGRPWVTALCVNIDFAETLSDAINSEEREIVPVISVTTRAFLQEER